jgi:hypothetical protein
MTRAVSRLDIDRVHVIVFVHVLTENFGLTLRASTGEVVCGSSRVGCVGLVAVCREQFGEDAADDGSEEGETGAYNGDVAFCGGPIGGSNVAVFAGC